MRPHRRPPGHVVGEAGYGLRGESSWAVNAEVAAVGARGEAMTAGALNELAARPGGPTVLHDLAIPIPGFTANVDHALVYGSRVLLIDTKLWRPGLYWTLGGRTRRGREPFPPADKQTMALAATRMTAYLTARSAGHALIDTPLVLIWPSRTSPPLRLWLLRVPGARAVPASRGLRSLARCRRFRQSADPAIVAALTPLVASVKHARSSAAWASGGEVEFDFAD